MDYQEIEKQKMANEGYCNKIKTFFNEHLQDESCGCGDRALWELVQNACDQSSEAFVEIELNNESLIFKHHGKPFDYKSFYSLVKQDSSKDQNLEDAEKSVGRYGTGFMTTHTFNKLVKVSGPYVVKEYYQKPDNTQEVVEKGYVQVKDFLLDRTKIDTPDGPGIMGQQLEKVDQLRDEQKSAYIINNTTSFRYDLTPDQVAIVSQQLQGFIRLLPFVFILNERLKVVRIDDTHSKTHVEMKKTLYHTETSFQYDGWIKKVEEVAIKHDDDPSTKYHLVRTLKSDKGDVVIIPPFPEPCGDVKCIPSLFLWFPLLGTESFGVNFIFHSARFYPVEKRDNIMLPGSSNQAKKTLGVKNGDIIKEMMRAVFRYYDFENGANTSELTMPFCKVGFPMNSDDEMERAFYEELQQMWAKELPNWAVIPAGDDKVKMASPDVKLLHPAFYTKLLEDNDDNVREYESILSAYAKLPLQNGAPYKFPENDLIEWSRIVNAWRCGRDEEFFLSPEDICSAISQEEKGNDLHAFLNLMKLGKNSDILEKYPVFPNRNGNLCMKEKLYHADFMSEQVYNLVSGLMGLDADKIVDTDYLDICTFNEYGSNDLQKSISTTISQWRTMYLQAAYQGPLSDVALNMLLGFCSASSLENPANMRSKLVPLISKFYGKENERTRTIRFLDQDKEEETFYEPSFNFLVDYTLRQISLKDSDWVNSQKEWLKDFLSTYEPDKNDEKKKKLDDYGVLPNQHAALCRKSDLRKNNGVPQEMVTIYDDVFKKTKDEESILPGSWIDPEFEGIVTLPEDTPEAIASEIQETLIADMKQEDRDNRKFASVVRQVILKIGMMPEWKQWFGVIDEMKAKFVFEMKDGPEQESLFKIMDLGKQDLEDLAAISSASNFRELIRNAKDQIEEEEERKRQFRFTYTIGKLIEDTLRKEVSSELSCEYPDLETADRQKGQDMVILNNGKVIYYLESKAKWNFSDPAHMSSAQMKQAVRNKERFALLCVDCTKETGAQVAPDASDGEVAAASQDILLHTYVHTDIGKLLKPTIGPQVEHEDDKSINDENTIKVYSSLSCNISKSVFRDGIGFPTFIEELKMKIKEYVQAEETQR